MQSPNTSGSIISKGGVRARPRTTRICLPALTQPAAERAVAEFWCLLERYGLGKPKIGVCPGDSHTLMLSFEFEQSSAGAVAAHLWAEDVERRLALRPCVRLVPDLRLASCK